MHHAATEELIMNLGGENTNTVIKDNVGTLFIPGETPESEINAVLADPAW